jgi:hypothetical protein
VDTTAGPVAHRLHGSTGAGWDAMSVPADGWRTLRNAGPGTALALLMTAGDHRKRIEWDAATGAAAHGAGWALDADGFVAPRRFVERAQG